MDGSGNTTLAGGVSQASAVFNSSLTKQGAGTLTLSGTNTYTFTGNTTVSAGTLAVTGSSVNANNYYTQLTVGGTGTGSAAATLNLSAGSLSANEVFIGSGHGSTGTVNQSGGSFNDDNYDFYLGYNSGSATYTLSGTSSTLSTPDAHVGSGSGSTGVFNQSGGSFTTNSHTLYVGDGGSGTYTLSGTGRLNTGRVFVVSAGGTGVFNLDGGTLTTNQITAGSGTSTFHFNGGTLSPGTSSTSFFSGLTTADVQAGGVILDTAGYDVTVAQNLTTGTANGTADGGLTKLGAGTLTLAGNNTYTGGTLISAGMLVAASNTALGSGNVEVAAGAELTLNAGVVLARVQGSTLTLDNALNSTLNLLGAGVQDTVGALVIAGINQLPGTYGAPGSGATFVLPDFTGTGELLVQAVPEPGIWALLAAGAGLLGVAAWRRRLGMLGLNLVTGSWARVRLGPSRLALMV